MGAVAAIIVAAGKGLRMKAETPKQYLMLQGRPIVGHTLLAFEKSSLVDIIYLVAPESDIALCRKTLLPPLEMKKRVIVIAGGPERQDSVYEGLKAAMPHPEIVLIHDGVRPLVSVEEIRGCIALAKRTGACILAVPVHDTLKNASTSGTILSTLDRRSIWIAQTPQAFRFTDILDAHERARQEGFVGTDDASLMERLGKPVGIVMGDRFNIKVTTPEDLLLAEAILQIRHAGG
jgi:2-C-methyl-D-erythritol 4-phosphate cytidylyltransferase